MQNDTITGIATAPGEGGIAIVRLSGPDAVSIFEKAFVPVGRHAPYESHRLMYGHIMDEGKSLDEAMGVVMYAPNSYTREDVCELQIHGGYASAALTAKLLIRLGARPADPGEFTRRAFMNGRIDLMQAEAVMGVISARSTAAFRAEQTLLEGGQSRFLRDAQERLVNLLAGLEAHIDYPDEISEEEALAGLLPGLEKLKADLEAAVDERSARILREGLRVALCGAPNAGKSTLFNALLGEDKAIVTDIPGTTRDVLEGSLSLDGVRILLQDTAGIRESGDQVERIGVERAKATLRNADTALLLVDASKPLTQEEKAMLQEEMQCPCAVLLSKEDAGRILSVEEAESLTRQRPILSVSAKTGEGMEEVRRYLRSFLRMPDELTLTHERHMSTARQAIQSLTQAHEDLTSGQPLDFAAIDLHEALYLLGRITGDSVDEKLLDDIFSRFCVGK